MLCSIRVGIRKFRVFIRILIFTFQGFFSNFNFKLMVKILSMKINSILQASKGSFTEFIIYGVLLGYLIFEIFAIMYFGNEITLASSDLCYSLYESNWMDQSAAYKKLIIIFMSALRQPETIVIGKLFPLSLSVFMSVSMLN